MPVPAPDPRAIRAENIEELRRLTLPLPPPQFPLVWEPGDQVSLRSTGEIEARCAVLHVVLARCFGLSAEAAMSWLLGSHLVDAVTPPEWQFVVGGRGDRRSFLLHHDAIYALAWLLGLTKHLDPMSTPDRQLMTVLPNIGAGETFTVWRSRTLTAPRDAAEAAAILDLYYCLDWAHLEAERLGLPLPGPLDANAIGQRRWALEWAVVFHGPYHDPPRGWEEVDLST
ncbi:MAG TPA: DUF4272 domain-containing protein [Micromonosporaceae bacterium]